jgi:glycosyltransferase involved in cell wall biosynthesis
VVGKGDVINNLRKRSSKPDLISKVLFVDALPYEKMMQYTINADVGVSLDKPNNLNYLYSLPNKVFDYLKVGIPIVCSDLVELSKIINIYNCGILIKNHQPKSILTALNSVLDEKNYSIFKAAALKVNNELNWENESESLINCYKKLV